MNKSQKHINRIERLNFYRNDKNPVNMETETSKKLNQINKNNPFENIINLQG